MALATIKGTDPNPRWEDYNFDEEYDTPVGKLRIIKTMPFGFRKIVLENIATPEPYNCDFTNMATARTAKDQLIEELKKNVKELTGSGCNA